MNEFWINIIIMQVIYLARNPKDVIVSYYHFHKLMKAQTFTGDLDQFAQYFMDNEREYRLHNLIKSIKFNLKSCHYETVFATPYFHHVLTAWQKRHHPNMLFMFYEDWRKVSFLRNRTSLLILLKRKINSGFAWWNHEGCAILGQVVNWWRVG